MQSTLIRPLALAALVVAAACDSPSGEKQLTPEDLRGNVVRGQAQQDSAGTRLADTLIVRVTDAQGRPVPNLTVGWTVVTQGGGEPFLATVQTDADGRARNFWNLGPKAGPHAMEVRAILDGQPVVLDSVTATARPGAAVSAAVSGDAVRTLARTQTVRVLLSGTDRHGNAIPAGEVAAAWTSSAPGVASVAADGTVTAAAPGRATLTAAGSRWTLRVHVAVNGTSQTARTAPSGAFIIHGDGARMLAAGAQILARQNGAWTVEPGAPASTFVRGVRVLPSGAAWAVVAGAAGVGVWRSDAPGAWAAVPPPAGSVPEMMASAGNTVFIGSLNGAVDRRDGDGWTRLPLQAGGPRSFGALAAVSADEVYLGGIALARGNDDEGLPLLLRWTGGAWTSVAIPASVAPLRSTYVRSLAAPRDGGPVYALIWARERVGNPTVYLLRIANGVATEVPLPASLRSQPLDGLAVGPTGVPYLSGGGHVAWLVDGAWREHAVTDGWTASGTPHVDAAGIVHVGAYRSVNGQELNAVLELEIIS